MEQGYARLAGLPLVIEDYRIEGLELEAAPHWRRHTSVVHLRGRGCEGLGEDVTWETADQADFQNGAAVLDLEGAWTLEAFGGRLDELDLFPAPPRNEKSRRFRRWAFESAALDLALRQAGRGLAEHLGRVPRPVRFVASPSLGSPPSLEPLLRRLELQPGLGFKLDASPDWSEQLIAELAELGAVDVVDLKSHYAFVNRPAEQERELTRRVLEGLPGVWIEDAGWGAATRDLLSGQGGRLAFDAPILGVEDLGRLPVEAAGLNLKPSRVGSLRGLFELYEHAAREGLACYGGGQFELGPGRRQIQVLASLFHPEGPNDVAPVAYHGPQPSPEWPASPLEPESPRPGFGA